MSGAPNVPQAEELAQTLREIADMDARMTECQLQVKKHTQEIDELSERRARGYDRTKQLLDAMDCLHRGNAGYDWRLFDLLKMLVRSNPVPK